MAEKDDDLLAAAVAKEAELVRQLEATSIYRQLTTVRQFIRDYRRETGVPPQIPFPGLNGKGEVRHRARLPSRLTGKKRNRIEEAANMAEKLIREKGAPMKRAELYDALVANGLAIGGKDPKNTLSARLAHSKRFVKVEDEGYALPDMVQH